MRGGGSSPVEDVEVTAIGDLIQVEEEKQYAVSYHTRFSFRGKTHFQEVQLKKAKEV